MCINTSRQALWATDQKSLIDTSTQQLISDSWTIAIMLSRTISTASTKCTPNMLQFAFSSTSPLTILFITISAQLKSPTVTIERTAHATDNQKMLQGPLVVSITNSAVGNTRFAANRIEKIEQQQQFRERDPSPFRKALIFCTVSQYLLLNTSAQLLSKVIWSRDSKVHQNFACVIRGKMTQPSCCVPWKFSKIMQFLRAVIEGTTRRQSWTASRECSFEAYFCCQIIRPRSKPDVMRPSTTSTKKFKLCAVARVKPFLM